MAYQGSGNVVADVRPKASHEQVKQLVFSRYGLTVKTIKTMVAYDDQNFHILVDSVVKDNQYIDDVHASGYVVKILNSEDSKHRLQNLGAQIRMMSHLGNNGITCSVHIRNKDNEFFSIENITSGGDVDATTGQERQEHGPATGQEQQEHGPTTGQEQQEHGPATGQEQQEHAFRVLKFIEGDVLDNHLPITSEIAYEGGQFVGEFRKALKGYQDFNIRRDDCQWNVLNVHWVRDYVKYVELEKNRAAAFQALDLWDKMWPLISKLDRVPIHNDINSTNTIVQSTKSEDGTSTPQIVGVIDFGESCLAPRIFDLAFYIMYMMTDAKEDYMEIGKRSIQGYLEVMDITECEKSILYYVIIARFTLSLVYGAYYYSIHKDPYLLLTQTGWEPLRILLAESPGQLMERWLPSTE